MQSLRRDILLLTISSPQPSKIGRKRANIRINNASGNFYLSSTVPRLFIPYTRIPSIARSNMDDQELQPVSNNSILIKSNATTQNGSADRDHADLIRLGKKPVLRVGLTLAVKSLPRLIGSICSVTSGSCRCWASAAPFWPPGKQPWSRNRRYVRREMVTNSHRSLFQLGFEKYNSYRRCTWWLDNWRSIQRWPSWPHLRIYHRMGRHCCGVRLSQWAGFNVCLNEHFSAPAKFCRAPTAGGQYHWVSMLAPYSSRKLFSYVTGRFKSLRSSLAGSDDLQAGSQLGGGRPMSRRSHTFAGRSSKDW